jgi:hypothetical protein
MRAAQHVGVLPLLTRQRFRLAQQRRFELGNLAIGIHVFHLLA